MSSARALNDEEVLKETKKMVEFIKQEALEKAREIQVKAEEDFNIEKAKIVRQESINIEAIFQRKIKQAEMQKRIDTSNHVNKTRLELLRERQGMLDALFADARNKLQDVSKDQTKYTSLLQDLVLQGFFTLMESDVTIICRAADKANVSKAAQTAAEIYKTQLGATVNPTVSSDNSLPPSSAGGVILIGQVGKIKVDNTLEARIAIIEEQMLPQIRFILFGHSENRKFFD